MFAYVPLETITYTYLLADGTYHSGALDEHGRTARLFSKESEDTKVLVGHTSKQWHVTLEDENEQSDAAHNGIGG